MLLQLLLPANPAEPTDNSESLATSPFCGQLLDLLTKQHDVTKILGSQHIEVIPILDPVQMGSYFEIFLGVLSRTKLETEHGCVFEWLVRLM